jgi:8-oxo-dGTP diphosphatase
MNSVILVFMYNENMSTSIPNCQILPAVAAAIFNEHGEILLQRRKDVDQWCIISGHVEFGETVEQAMLREVMEETNTEGKISRFIGIYSSPASQTYHYESRSVQYITSYFEVQLQASPDLSFSNEETGELRFFPVTALPQQLAQISEHWLSDVLDRSHTPFIR